MWVKRVIEKNFIRDITRDFIKLLFDLIGTSFLSMYREVLEGTYGKTFKFVNPKDEYITEQQSI